jgi:MFS transporter, SP family, sugar:H+ symporter
LISFNLAALQQLSGIDFVSAYSVQLSTEIASGEASLVLPSIINFSQIIPLIIASILLRHFGRKPILLLGVVAGFIANLIIGIGFFIRNSSIAGTIFLYCGIFLYMIAFGLSLGPVIFLYIPEVISPRQVSYTITVMWIAATIAVTLFPILTNDVLNGNPGVLFFFSAGVCFLSIFPIYFWLVETKDKTEKQIIDDYRKIYLCKANTQQSQLK